MFASPVEATVLYIVPLKNSKVPVEVLYRNAPNTGALGRLAVVP
jgi:hypothetical protein